MLLQYIKYIFKNSIRSFASQVRFRFIYNLEKFRMMNER